MAKKLDFFVDICYTKLKCAQKWIFVLFWLGNQTTRATIKMPLVTPHKQEAAAFWQAILSLESVNNFRRT